MKRHVRIVGSIVLLVCIGTGPVRALPVSGRVVDYRARPVAGAEVAVYERYEIDREPYGRIAGPIVRTDEQGDFSLEAQTASQYDTFIVARKEGLAPAWDGLNYGGNTKFRGCFLLVLERPAELTGVVVDGDGKPVAGAKVQAVPKTSYLDRLRQRPIFAPEEWFTTQTDADGRFRFDAFCPDVSVDFRVHAPPRASTYEFSTHYLDGCGFEVGRTDIHLVLPRETRVMGRVIDRESGKPVGNVPLMIRPKREVREDIRNLYLPARTVSDADGRVVFAGVPEGKHLVEVFTPDDGTPEWAATPVEIETGTATVLDEVEIVVTKGAMIEIASQDAQTGKPLPHAYASVSQKEIGLSIYRPTDQAGIARLRVVPGDYTVSAWGAKAHSWEAKEPVSVTAGQVVRVEAKLWPADCADGLVREPQGKPAAGVLVSLHPGGDVARTDENGAFHVGCDNMRGMEGTWVIAVDSQGQRGAAARVEEKGKPVELVLTPALNVTGRVADPNGNPIPAARVALSILISNFLCSLEPEVLTDPNGQFRLTAIPPVEGMFEYRISIHATDFGPKEYEKTTVGGEPGSTCDLGTIQLLPADTSVAGVVVDCDGNPAPRVPIFLRGQQGVDQPNKTTATDEQGRFRIMRVCRGPINLQANFNSSPGGSARAGAEGGQQDIQIKLPGSVIAPQLLLGKPLPATDDLGLPAPPAEQAVLLCFFDVNQRPSRNCLTQLARQAESLEQKGVAVLCVQVPKTDRLELDQWTKESNIPFPVGMVRQREEEVRQKWGIRSLPWLILTDSGHLVRAEGFAIGHLDSKIQEEKP